MNKHETLGVTGNRPHKLPPHSYKAIQERLWRLLSGFKKQGGQKIITGAATGIDTWAATAALSHDLSLLSYVPFPQQADNWGISDQEVYKKILGKSKEIITFGDVPKNNLFFVRNQAIVNNSDIMVAITSPVQSGGGWWTAQFALKRNKPLIWVIVNGSGELEEKFFPSKQDPLFT